MALSLYLLCCSILSSVKEYNIIPEKKGKKFIECYELDSYGTFIVDKDEDSDYFGALTPVMELYYKYVGRREVDEIDEDGSMSIKPIKTKKKKKNK